MEKEIESAYVLDWLLRFPTQPNLEAMKLCTIYFYDDTDKLLAIDHADISRLEIVAIDGSRFSFASLRGRASFIDVTPVSHVYRSATPASELREETIPKDESRARKWIYDAIQSVAGRDAKLLTQSVPLSEVYAVLGVRHRVELRTQIEKPAVRVFSYTDGVPFDWLNEPKMILLSRLERGEFIGPADQPRDP